MTREQASTNLAAYVAFCEGRAIQQLSQFDGQWVDCVADPDWSSGSVFRPKPTTLRPFTKDEAFKLVDKERFFIRKGDLSGTAYTIELVGADRIYVSASHWKHGEMNSYTFYEFFCHFENGGVEE